MALNDSADIRSFWTRKFCPASESLSWAVSWTSFGRFPSKRTKFVLASLISLHFRTQNLLGQFLDVPRWDVQITSALLACLLRPSGVRKAPRRPMDVWRGLRCNTRGGAKVAASDGLHLVADGLRWPGVTLLAEHRLHHVESCEVHQSRTPGKPGSVM